MAATTLLKLQTQPTKPKRRYSKETTISSSATATATATATNSDSTQQIDPATILSPGKSTFSPSRPDSATSSPSNCRIRFSPGNLSPVMDFTAASTAANGHDSFPSSFTKFNSALNAGLLNPMSPPPDKIRSSPTLFEMMVSEPDTHLRTTTTTTTQVPLHKTAAHLVVSSPDKQAVTIQRLSDLLATRSPGNQFNDTVSSDIKLTLSSKDGVNVSMSVHRQILVAHSRFFAVQLSDRWAKQQKPASEPYIVEIADCDDVEVYVETLMLMYCKDLRRKLMREDVPRVLGILKVSAAIGFDAGVLSCLEFLEAAPWAEDEEEQVASLLAELHLENVGATEVLKRVSIEISNRTEETSSENEEVLLKLLHVVLGGKDEKARREMKGLVSKMLRENTSQTDLRKESLYSACDMCLQSLEHHFLLAAASHFGSVNQIAREADNLYWILDILIDRQIADDFLRKWTSQSKLSDAHSKVPAVHRHEISKVTARLFVGIGKGQLLAPKEARWSLLQTWLVPFYDDFAWMKRASKGLDRHLIEDGLSNTILTLPLARQQEIFLAWFDRFLNSGEDCPNIQRGFEVWWRRAFRRRNGEQKLPSQLRVTATTT